MKMLLEKHVVFMDKKDFIIFKKFNWRVYDDNGRYYLKGGTKKIQLFHRMIMGAQRGQEVDHKNHNGLDNRRSNLRLCNHSQNMANKAKSPNKILPKGVYKNWNGTFKAEIKAFKKYYYLGCFKTPEKAAMAYRKAAKKHYGEFAYEN